MLLRGNENRVFRAISRQRRGRPAGKIQSPKVGRFSAAEAVDTGPT